MSSKKSEKPERALEIVSEMESRLKEYFKCLSQPSIVHLYIGIFGISDRLVVELDSLLLEEREGDIGLSS